MSKRERYIVISYDKDEQQTFYDWISVDSEVHDTEEEAVAIVGRLRPYALPVCALPPDDLESMRSNLLAAPDTECLPFHKQVKDLSRERLVDLIDEVTGVGVRDEQDLEELREEVRQALEDGDIDAEQEDLYIQ